MEGNGAKRAITPDSEHEFGSHSHDDKENRIMQKITKLQADKKTRQMHDKMRGLNSLVGDRLRMSKKPSTGEITYKKNQHERINKIEESIFVDARELHTGKTFNQLKSSTQNPLVTRN